ncbi:MAG: helicase-related protein, partial [Nitrososphaerales archaeon]
MKTYVSHPLIYPYVVEERLYQRRIAQAASDMNTLAVLPTALGKTVISALVAADILYNYSGKRVLVMAPTRPLVMQHRNSFQRIIRLPAEEFTMLTGKTGAEYRSAIWNGPSRIIFATPQVVRNDILKNGLTLKDFGLLIFDECHRAVKEYAYTEVARHYVEVSEYPLILGLTASPGSDLERVRMVCESLYIEHVEYRSDEDEDVKPYIQPVDVEWRVVKLPIQYQPLIDILKGVLDSEVMWLQSRGYLKNVFKDVAKKRLIELGAELRYNLEMSIEEERGQIYQAIMHQTSALTTLHMLELLQTQGAYTLKKFIERMEMDDKRSHNLIVKQEYYIHLTQLLKGPCNIDHPKIQLLKNTLQDQLKNNPSSRILVFTQYRDTATHLVEELNQVEGVRAERFVGQASKMGDKGLTQEQQAALIEDLRRGYINTLVSTSIAEEGLDIPEVDLVVFYEPIPSEIRYIQRRGRTGRRTAGKVIILATEHTYDTIYLYTSERRVKKMKYIMDRLNTTLKPILRFRVKPSPTPLTPQELSNLYSRAGSKPEPLTSEKKLLSDISRDVSRAERAIYLKILEKGVMGIDNEALYKEMEEEGYSRSIVIAALKKLVKSKHVKTQTSKTTLQIKDIPGARLMTITIEKILPQAAIVWV